MLAAGNNREGCVRLLLEAGADVSLKCNSGKTALDLSSAEAIKAILRGPSDDVMKAAEAAKAKYGSKPLADAANGYDNEAIKALLASGYKDLEERDGDGYTALINAALRGMDSSVKALLDAGADKNAKETQVRFRVPASTLHHRSST
jgi:ankyrin repeat protein